MRMWAWVRINLQKARAGLFATTESLGLLVAFFAAE